MRTTISSLASDNSINCSAASFQTYPVGTTVDLFGLAQQAGQTWRCTVVSATASKLVLSGHTLVNESAGASVSCLLNVYFYVPISPNGTYTPMVAEDPLVGASGLNDAQPMWVHSSRQFVIGQYIPDYGMGAFYFLIPIVLGGFQRSPVAGVATGVYADDSTDSGYLTTGAATVTASGANLVVAGNAAMSQFAQAIDIAGVPNASSNGVWSQMFSDPACLIHLPGSIPDPTGQVGMDIEVAAAKWKDIKLWLVGDGKTHTGSFGDGYNGPPQIGGIDTSLSWGDWTRCNGDLGFSNQTVTDVLHFVGDLATHSLMMVGAYTGDQALCVMSAIGGGPLGSNPTLTNCTGGAHYTGVLTINGNFSSTIATPFNLDGILRNATVNMGFGTSSNLLAINNLSIASAVLNVSANAGFGAGTYVVAQATSAVATPLGMTVGTMPAGFAGSLAIGGTGNKQVLLTVSEAPVGPSAGLSYLDAVGTWPSSFGGACASTVLS